MEEASRPAVERFGPPHRALERRLITTGGPGLRLRFYPGVRGDIRRRLKEFARWLRGEVEFRHPVRATVVPNATVMGHEGPAGWAVFLIPPVDYAPGDVVRIFVGAGKVEVLERHFGLSGQDAQLRLAHDFAHEVVHYEQWRDGRPITERGVNRRASSLVNRFCLEALRYDRPPLEWPP